MADSCDSTWSTTAGSFSEPAAMACGREGSRTRKPGSLAGEAADEKSCPHKKLPISRKHGSKCPGHLEPVRLGMRESAVQAIASVGRTAGAYFIAGGDTGTRDTAQAELRLGEQALERLAALFGIGDRQPTWRTPPTDCPGSPAAHRLKAACSPAPAESLLYDRMPCGGRTSESLKAWPCLRANRWQQAYPKRPRSHKE